jgi:hypothetical protein
MKRILTNYLALRTDHFWLIFLIVKIALLISKPPVGFGPVGDSRDINGGAVGQLSVGPRASLLHIYPELWACWQFARHPAAYHSG